MKKRMVYAAFAIFTITAISACKETNNYNGNGDPTPIRLSSSVELGTQRIQEIQIYEGQALSFFVTEGGNVDEVLYENQEIMASGTGGFTYQQTMYYPTDGSNVDFYALHPYFEDATLDQNVTFSIATDQRAQDNYLNSDLLYATKKDVARTVSAVSLGFVHKLAKLDFVIIQGDGADISGINAVGTLGALPSISIDPATGNTSEPSGTRTEIISYGVSAPTNGEQQVSGISAIIVPQTFTSGQRLFRIRLGGIDYYYTPDRSISFEPGYRYTLELTINQAGIELESSIANWLDGGTISGEGSIE